MLTIPAPAKINWFLKVLGKRNDGYHDIRSLMQLVTLNDSLMIESSPSLEIETDAAIPPSDNLVYRAMILLRDHAGMRRGAKIRLKKEIPLEAGLGGGSSDAAAALAGLNRLWGLGLGIGELMKLGAMLGSDVPFFIGGPVAHAEGRGEIISPVRLTKSYTILLVKPDANISTPWAYAEIDADRATGREVLTEETDNIKLFCLALEKGDFSCIGSLQANDFEPVVIRSCPVVGEIKRTVLMNGAVFASMSGSGPTVFGVFESVQKAAGAAEKLTPHWCRIVSTISEA